MIRAVAFDFDGVLVETAAIKTRAFARLFEREGAEIVERIVRYHLSNGGISRYEKFRAIYREMLHRPLSERELRRLSEGFAALVVESVIAAPWVAGAREFLMAKQGRYRFVLISGTPHEELRQIVGRRCMERFFEDILGSPTAKDILLRDVMSRRRLLPAEVVFVGDAETDWVAARQTGVRFVWRRASGDRVPDDAGPVIRSLTDLEACLLAMEREDAVCR